MWDPLINTIVVLNVFFLTLGERDADTVIFSPKNIKYPEVILADFLKQAATDKVALLQNPPKTTMLQKMISYKLYYF